MNELEEGAWSEDDYEAWPKDELTEVKGNIKSLGGELKEIQRELKNKQRQLRALRKAQESTVTIETTISQLETRNTALEQEISREEKRIIRHLALENELKQCKKIIKEIKDRKEQLLEEARKKIDANEAKRLILARWQRTLHSTVNDYLLQYQRSLRAAVENFWAKYYQPLYEILKNRDEASKELAVYLKELGYE